MTHIGVIGTGVMGFNHVRVLSNLKGVEVSISDIDKNKCNEVASTFKVKSSYNHHHDLLEKEKLDGVIVAVPSPYHKEIFLDCIKHKVNILMEKPIAENIQDAQLMINKAKQENIIFTAGHIERFNPVIATLKNMISELGEIYMVHTIRAGPFPKRLYGQPGGVLIDLAVHDVDIINYLVGNIKEVYSKIMKSSKQEIYAKALFKITNKIIGSSEFSWISPKTIRTIEVYCAKGMLRGNYMQQTLHLYENPEYFEIPYNKNLFESVVLEGNVGAGKIIQYPIKREEPLKLELQNFVDSINNKAEPLVKPEEALEAMKIALAILKAGDENRTIKL